MRIVPKRLAIARATAGRRLPIGLLLTVFASTAQAWELDKQFTVPVAVEHDSNPGMSATNEKSIWRARFTPGIKLTAGDGINQWFADAKLNVERSSDTAISLNREDPTVNFGWKHELERGNFSITAHYDEQSTRISELEDTGVVQKDGSRTSMSLAAAWTRALNERLMLNLNGGYTDVSYDGGTTSGYTSPSASAALSYALSEKAEPFIQLSYMRYQPESNADASNLTGVLAGLRWKASELLSGSVQGGLNRVTGATSDTSWQGSADITYAAERTSTTASLSRSISPAGSLGGFTESDLLRLAMSYEFSDRARVGGDVSWRITRSVNTSEFRQIGGWYARELTEFWNLRLYAQYKEQSQSGGQDAKANILGVSFVYTHLNF